MRARPVGAAEFARLIAGLGPFESRPQIAVAVSGGADSMALILLCDRWARARGGKALAVSVDHRLRPESAVETRQVARWLKARGIPHASLAWRHGSDGSAALQARARAARYALLCQWCRKHAILNLALAHHAGDQAETVLMRLTRGGGIDGLAGMSAVASREGVRLIRPLLGIDPARLRATLKGAKQGWIEDPSNANQAFERVRWRTLIPADLVPDLAGALDEIGRERGRREADLADLLVQARIDLAGFLSMPIAELLAAPAALAERALARCLVVIGGEDYPPAQDSLARLRESLVQGPVSRTLGGCRLICRAGDLQIFRELGAARERLAVRRGQAVRWDNRFDLVTNAAGEIARLGESGWALLPAAERPASIPRAAALALPALWTTGRRPGRLLHLFLPGNSRGETRFRPGQPLVPSGFTVAKLNVNII
jgi:tRNA(Ile)-lysidine synthase